MLSRVSSGRLLLSALAVLSALQLRALEPVPEIAPGKNWEKFTIMIWGFHTNPIQDKAAYEAVNIHAFHVDRANAELSKFGKENNWPYYVDHAAGKGYLHLGDAGFKQVSRKLDIVVRPNSFSDPKTMQAMKDLLKTNIESAKGGTALAYAFDDEISLGQFCSPVETDGSTGTIEQFRKWLEKQYKSIEKLNAQYGSSFKDFNEIAPKSFEAFRGQVNAGSLGGINLSQWCDWRTFMDDQWADVLAELTRYANSLDSTTPAGFVGGHNPSAWGGSDYRKLTKAVQWMEAYDIGATNEILRSFWTQKRPHVQTYFSSGNARSDSWFIWYYLCHGDRGLIVWPAFKKDGKEAYWFAGGKPQDNIAALAPTFKETQGPLSQKIIDGEFVHDPIAIYYSHQSIRMTWVMDAITHGKTWPNRSSSMDNGLATSSLTRIAWLKTLEDIGLQARFIHEDHLLSGALIKDGYKVLLLNRVLCLSDAEVAAIQQFADKGGVVIADHLCGIFDEHGKSRPEGALDKLFGVKRDLSKGILNGKTLTEADGEKGGGFSEKTWVSENVPVAHEMLVYERGLSAKEPAKAESTAGEAGVVIRNGKHVYLNLSNASYLLKRPKGQGKEWLDLASGIFASAGLTPRVKLQINGKPAEQTESIFWKNGDSTTLCVIKNISRSATIDSFGSTAGGVGEEKQKLKLVFKSPVKNLKNERTGKDLGAGSEFEDEFTPWEANVYTYQ